jgi:segregation and condensation protein B
MPTDNQNHLDRPTEELPEGAATSEEAIPSAEESVDFLTNPSLAAEIQNDPGLASDAIESPADENENGEALPSAPAMDPIDYRDLSNIELQSAVESLLFCSHRPMTLGKIKELINPHIPEDDYRSALSNIMAAHFDDAKGIELVEVANGYQFRTKSQNRDFIRRFFQIAPMKLTNAMLEVIAIVAYNQPVTKEYIEKIRGVDSSHLVRALLDKKMVRIVGKSDELGKPMLYGTTKEFLELFGLRDLGSLPSLREIEDMIPQNEVGTVAEEDLLAKEMEGISESSQPLEFNDLEIKTIETELDTLFESEPSAPAGASTMDPLLEKSSSEPTQLGSPQERMEQQGLLPKGNA